MMPSTVLFAIDAVRLGRIDPEREVPLFLTLKRRYEWGEGLVSGSIR